MMSDFLMHLILNANLQSYFDREIGGQWNLLGRMGHPHSLQAEEIKIVKSVSSIFMFFSMTKHNIVSSFDLNIGLQTKNYFIWQILIAKLVYLVQYCPDNIFTARVWGQVESRKIWVRAVRLE